MDDEEKNLDLEKLVEAFAWKNYDEAALGDRRLRKLRKKHNKNNFLDVRVNWSKVNFENCQKDWGRMPTSLVKKSTSNGSPAQRSGGDNASSGPTWYNERANDRLLPDVGRPGVNVLFQTVFTNNSNKEQTYNMKTEKTTMSSCETEIESSFTKGFSFDLTLKTPCEVVEANAGYSREFSLTKCKGETLEKSVTWSVESSIVVEENHVAEAFLVVDEANFKGNFAVVSKVWGDVGFGLHDMRKPDAPQVFYSKCSIFKIVKDFLATERSKPGKAKVFPFVDVVDAAKQQTTSGSNAPASTDASNGGGQSQQSPTRSRRNHILITTRGTCEFKYGIKQEVLVNQTKLEDYKKIHPDQCNNSK